jgi:hypothetical protein
LEQALGERCNEILVETGLFIIGVVQDEWGRRMKFSEMVDQARALLQRTGKITYRTLKREFALDDEALADLKDELLFSDPHVKEEDGRGLVWTGAAPVSSSPQLSPPHLQPPTAYTPAHLAERILAEQAAMESRGATNGERKTICGWERCARRSNIYEKGASCTRPRSITPWRLAMGKSRASCV